MVPPARAPPKRVHIDPERDRPYHSGFRVVLEVAL